MKKRPRKNCRRSARFEALEPRQVLATGLSASLNTLGTLTIKGTSKADNILIRDLDGRISIAGIKTSWLDTKVRSINVNLGITGAAGGDDCVSLNSLANGGNIELSKFISVSSSKGLDRVTLPDRIDVFFAGLKHKLVVDGGLATLDGVVVDPVPASSVTLGNYVWNDVNANGTQDSGETGLAGVTLTLTGLNESGGSVVDHATTDATGHYLFTEVPGTYTVTVDAGNFTGSGALAAFTASPTLVGSDRSVDSSGNAASPGALLGGTSDLSLDFGFFRKATLGNFVWNDANGNGRQDSGETGLAGVTLTLTGTNGGGSVVLDHATTDAGGHYLFTEDPGAYTVTIDAANFVGGGVLAGFTASPTLVGADRNVDSDINPTSAAALLDAGSDLSLDFGYFRTVTLGNLVWNDTNGNGRQDSGEVGLAGVTLTLTGTNNNNGNVVDHATTDANGNYLFTEVPGTYTITVDASNFTGGGSLVGYSASPALQGADRNVDSNTNPTGPGALLGAASDVSLDFGFFRAVTLGNRVWIDTNANGIQESGETGLSGVKLTLTGTSSSGAAITDHATTDANGNYLFTEAPGTYTVTVDAGNFTGSGILVGHTASPTLQGADRSVDSNANPTSAGALSGGASDLSLDFGYFRNVTIGNFIWKDANANGIQDSGETGLAGVTLTLTGTGSSGASITDHATSDANGNYLFTEIPGTYTVTVDASNFTGSGALVGYTASPTLQGADRSVDSNANPSSAGALSGGASDLSLDFSYFRNVTIGNFIWKDANANGIQDSGETGLAGVTLTLTGTSSSGASITDHATSDANGNYLFTEIPGNYTVTVDASNFTGSGALVGYTASLTLQGANRSVDSNANPSSPGALLSGSSDLSLDFGFFRSVTLGNRVWNDANGNGIQDSGESGLAGVTLTLTGTSGSGAAVTDHATTDASGNYLFTEAPGTYTVSVDANNFTGSGALVGYTASATLQGADRTVDSNANPTSPGILLSGSSDLSLDFGYSTSNPNPPLQNWFDTHIQDAVIRSWGSQYFQDGLIDRADLINLLRKVETTGALDATEMSDLQLIVNTTSLFGNLDYVQILGKYIVLGNAANATYQGAALGNLAVGSSAAKLEMLLDKWFLGTDHATANTSYTTASGPLFLNGASYTDVRQGGLGDCYLMAALAEVAFKNSSLITSMFIDNGDGTYTFRYYDDASPYTQEGTANYVTVDRQLPTGVADYSQELWVALAEKAYAQTKGDYNALNAGSSPVVSLNQLTGNTWLFPIFDQATFVADYNAGSLIALASAAAPVSPNVVQNHAYALINYNSSTQILTLYNPWGFPVTISWSEVSANFASVQGVNPT